MNKKQTPKPGKRTAEEFAAKIRTMKERGEL